MSENTIIHEGTRYRKVNRWANAGELVLIENCEEHPKLNGEIVLCLVGNEFDDGSIDVNIPSEQYGDYSFIDNDHDKYYVLEPLETVDTTQASPSVVDMLANLARRVTSLEQQLRDTQGNVERQAEELAEINQTLKSPSQWATQHEVIELNEKVEMALDDIITLDARTQSQTDPAFETITLPKWFVAMLTKLDGGAKR